jgi:hypothetical protein
MLKTSIVLAAVMASVASAIATGATTPQLQGTKPGTEDWCRANNRSNDRETHSEVREFIVPASGATVAVDAAPNGGISVEGQVRSDIQVRACVSATAATAEQARALVQRVEVIATANRVAAEGPQNLAQREGWHVSYRLAVPNRTSMSLQTSNGGISLSDLDGQIDFATVNGGVTLNRLAGHVRGRTTNGGVTVDLDGATWNGEGLEVETQNGGVRMSIPADYSARLETATSNGGLNSDFPVANQGRNVRSIETQLGSGGPLIKVRTQNGGVNIRRK